MHKISLELKVGSFVLSGFIFFCIITFSIGDFYAVKKGYRMSVVAELAGGISHGSIVRYAGVEVGKVDDVKLLPNKEDNTNRVEIIIWLPEYIKIEEDARANIHTLGLLGEKYLDIMPGTSGRRILSLGEALVASSGYASLEELSIKGSNVLDGLELTLKSIHDIASDEKIKQNVKNALSNSEELTAELTQTARKANDILGDLQKGKGSLGKLLYDDRLYEELLAITEDLKQHPWKLLYRPKEKRR